MLSGDNLCSLIHSTVYQLKSNPIKYSYKYGWCSRLLNVAHLIGKVMISYCGDSWVMVTPGEGSSVLRLASWGGRSGWWEEHGISNSSHSSTYTQLGYITLIPLHTSHFQYIFRSLGWTFGNCSTKTDQTSDQEDLNPLQYIWSPLRRNFKNLRISWF